VLKLNQGGNVVSRLPSARWLSRERRRWTQKRQTDGQANQVNMSLSLIQWLIKSVLSCIFYYQVHRL